MATVSVPMATVSAPMATVSVPMATVSVSIPYCTNDHSLKETSTRNLSRELSAISKKNHHLPGNFLPLGKATATLGKPRPLPHLVAQPLQDVAELVGVWGDQFEEEGEETDVAKTADISKGQVIRTYVRRYESLRGT